MRVFSRFENRHLKKDTQGRTLFYPWSMFGAGIIVTSDEQREQIRRLLVQKYLIVPIPIFLLILTVSFLWMAPNNILPVWVLYLLIFALPMAGSLFWYYCKVDKIVKGAAKTTVKLTIDEMFKYSLPNLIVRALVCLGFFSGGFWLLRSGNDPLIAYLTIIMFGCCSIFYARKIFARIRGH